MKCVILALLPFTLVSVGCDKPKHAPAAPSAPAGATVGYVGCDYDFRVFAEDPDGDSVTIRFNWGDGDSVGWSSLVASGDTVGMSHKWSSAGAFSVTAQAKDNGGNTSSWSASHVMTVSAGWNVTLGGDGGDWGNSVQETEDGGFIIAGGTKSYGAEERDAWLVKTDAVGSITWSKTLGGRDDDEEAYSVVQTADGGFVLTGQDATNALWLVKTDANGSVVWDGAFGSEATGFSVQQTSDGGFIFVGTSYGTSGGNNVLLIKTDAEGGEMWSRTFGGVQPDGGACVQQTTDGGYVVVGCTASEGAGSYDVWLIKTTPQGGVKWSKTYGGTGDDEGAYVRQTQDGGYVVVGKTKSFGAGNFDAWLIRTDAEGTELWNKVLGGTGSDEATCVDQTQDGGFVVTGEYFASGRSSDVWLLKLDASGDVAWEKMFGGTAYDAGSSVEQTRDGGYVVVGRTTVDNNGQVYLIRTGAFGE
jgi:hypothetical protein